MQIHLVVMKVCLNVGKKRISQDNKKNEKHIFNINNIVRTKYLIIRFLKNSFKYNKSINKFYLFSKVIVMKLTMFYVITINVNAQENIIKEPEYIYGSASFYANKFQGRKTASGEIFDQSKMTAASNKVPLGTWVRVTNLKNGKEVVVKINDRMHKKMKRVIDLSYSSAKKLGFIKSGITKVKMQIVEENEEF